MTALGDFTWMVGPSERISTKVEVSGVRLVGQRLGTGLGLLARTHVELYRDIVERQVIPEDGKKIALVSCVEEPGAVYKQDDGWRREANLGRIVDSWGAVFACGRWVGLDGLADDPVERSGAHAFLGLLIERLCQVQKRLDVLPRL